MIHYETPSQDQQVPIFLQNFILVLDKALSWKRIGDDLK